MTHQHTTIAPGRLRRALGFSIVLGGAIVAIHDLALTVLI